MGNTARKGHTRIGLLQIYLRKDPSFSVCQNRKAKVNEPEECSAWWNKAGPEMQTPPDISTMWNLKMLNSEKPRAEWWWEWTMDEEKYKVSPGQLEYI